MSIYCHQAPLIYVQKLINLGLAQSINMDISQLSEFRSHSDDDKVPLTLPKGVIEVNEINWNKIVTSHPLLPPQEQGSNSWCISSKYTVDGKPILASHPHLTVSVPNVWMQIHLNCDEFNAVGAGLVGLPFINIGHTDQIATGITLSYTDTADIYVEQFDTNDPTRYWFKGQWKQAHLYEETINIKGKSPHLQKVRVTQHGPVISGVVKRLMGLEHENKDENFQKELSIKATFLQPIERANAFESSYYLIKATNWKEFATACQMVEEFSLNVTYADKGVLELEQFSYWICYSW